MPLANPVLIQDVPRSRSEPPPVFLIHDASGLVTNYFKLGRLGRRVYGIWDPKFDADGVGGWQSIREIAEAYVRLVKRIMIRGEIVLGGWSFGGIIAVQMAHIFATSSPGLRVFRIILIDSVYPRCTRPDARKQSARLYHIPALNGISQDTREKLMTALMRATRLSDQWSPPQWSIDRVENLCATQSERIHPKAPFAILIRAKDMVPMVVPDDRCLLDRTRFLQQLGWEDMMKGFIKQVIEVTGNHYILFDPENVCD